MRRLGPEVLAGDHPPAGEGGEVLSFTTNCSTSYTNFISIHRIIYADVFILLV
jgi:hypothetical protein